MFCATLVAAFLYTFSAVALLAHGAAVNEAKRDGIFDPLTSKIGGEISSIGSEVTSVIDGVEKSVETIGNDVLTVVKDASGAAFTLAADGVGLATTIGGQLYTVITSDIGHMATSTSTGNSAMGRGVQAWAVSAPLLCGLLTVVGSTVLGAWVAL